MTTERVTLVRCVSCGHTHAAAAWRARPTLQLLAPNDVRRHVVAWVDVAIEVRACAGCGRGIARMALARGNDQSSAVRE